MKRTRIILTVLALAIAGGFVRPASGQKVMLVRARRTARKAETAVARPDVARFRSRVESALSGTVAAKGYWGVLVTDADSGAVLYSLNSSSYFLPASNAKLFTTAMALATLGPDFREHTTIETTSELSANGKLHGDLVLVGRGDPNLSNRVFPFVKDAQFSGPPDGALAALADQVVAKGVREIEGDVVADDTYFALARFPSGWTVDDAVWNYGAAISAIAVNDNTMRLTVTSGPVVGAPLNSTLQLASAVYQVRTTAKTTAPGTEAQLRLAREPESQVFVVSGTMPLGAPARVLVLAVPQPAEYAADLLRRELEARGVRVNGTTRGRHEAEVAGACCAASASPMVLAERLSPPLLQDVQVTNKLSLNLHAELMLRVAAKEKGGAMILDDSLKFAEQFRQTEGIAPDEVQFADGSGLSRSDLVTPQSVVQLLAWSARQRWGADFAASLPVAGEDGTLENRMKNTAAAGRVHAKTGSVAHDEALSGYATSVRGEHLIFSFIANNLGVHTRDAVPVLDSICVAMVEELGAGGAPAAAAGER